MSQTTTNQTETELPAGGVSLDPWLKVSRWLGRQYGDRFPMTEAGMNRMVQQLGEIERAWMAEANASKAQTQRDEQDDRDQT